MQRDLKVYLWDIQQALEEIESFTSGKAQADYLSERILRSAVERQFITVGEVISRIIHYFPEAKARIVRREKHRELMIILPSTTTKVWRIITISVPVLKQQVRAWLSELDPQHR